MAIQLFVPNTAIRIDECLDEIKECLKRDGQE